LTFAAFNPVVYKVERAIDEEKYKAKVAGEADSAKVAASEADEAKVAGG